MLAFSGARPSSFGVSLPSRPAVQSVSLRRLPFTTVNIAIPSVLRLPLVPQLLLSLPAPEVCIPVLVFLSLDSCILDHLRLGTIIELLLSLPAPEITFV